MIDTTVPNVRVVELELQPTIAVRITRSVEALPSAINEFLPKIGVEARRRGATFAGPPFLLYHGMAGGTFDVEIGMPLAVAATALSTLAGMPAGHVGTSELPGGRTAIWEFTGPYADLGRGWNEFNAWMHDSGFVGGTTWESYIDNPDTVPASTLRTELCQAIF